MTSKRRRKMQRRKRHTRANRGRDDDVGPGGAQRVAEQDVLQLFAVDRPLGQDNDAERKGGGEDDADRRVVSHPFD